MWPLRTAATASTVDFAGAHARPVDVATGSTHACALLDDGTVWCWGSNLGGQLGSWEYETEPPMSMSATPIRVPGVTGATAIAASGLSTCAIDRGRLVCWGGSPPWGDCEWGDGSRSALSWTPRSPGPYRVALARQRWTPPSPRRACGGRPTELLAARVDRAPCPACPPSPWATCTAASWRTAGCTAGAPTWPASSAWVRCRRGRPTTAPSRHAGATRSPGSRRHARCRSGPTRPAPASGMRTGGRTSCGAGAGPPMTPSASPRERPWHAVRGARRGGSVALPGGSLPVVHGSRNGPGALRRAHTDGRGGVDLDGDHRGAWRPRRSGDRTPAPASGRAPSSRAGRCAGA